MGGGHMRVWAWLLLAGTPLRPSAALVPATCTADQAARVRASIGDITEASKCPDSTWKPRFAASHTLHDPATPVVIFDIGCNKGFDAVNSLRLFAQSSRFDVVRWARQTRFRCGVCSQCRKNFDLPSDPRPRLATVHCIEPLPANFETLRRAARELALDQHGLRVVHGALTNLSDAVERGWAARFPVVRGWRARLPTSWKLQGAEQIGIDVNPLCPDCDTEPVPLLVLDRYVAEHAIHRIDILSLDTEGNDALVLAGAAGALRRRVRYVEFEYGTTGAWGRLRLPHVLRPLEAAGFVCYWLGKRRLWRITRCWHADYGTVKVWANIGCVHRREAEWLEVMEDIFRSTVPEL